MTERKTQRNTKELTISDAIEKLRGVEREQEDEVAEAAAKVLKRNADKTRNILLRVPEAVRSYVIKESGISFDFGSNGIELDAPIVDPALPEELPPGAREMPAEQKERVARLTGKART